ncbi:MAG: hypothetical protein HYW02_03425, partial [Deltaproteobacteria bacterium]|nr:hypothetical protein [Deltaproteobacteria bacterium]
MSRVAFAPLPLQDESDPARSFIDISISSQDQRSLLHSLLDQFPTGENSPYVDIPLLVYGGIAGREEEALPLTALGKFLFLGMDIID